MTQVKETIRVSALPIGMSALCVYIYIYMSNVSGGYHFASSPMGLNRFLEQSTVSVELVSLTWGNSLQCYCQCARSRALSIHQAGRLRGSTYPHLIKLSPLRPLESVQFSSLFSFQRNTKGAKHKVPSAEKDYGGHFG